MASPSLTWLYSVQQFGIKPGLENTRRLLKEMQLPGPQQRFLHVAGTNGKGSTCAFMESLLRAAGERTALFTSPHLVSWCERIQVQGRMIPQAEADAGIDAIRQLVEPWRPHPTFFELTMMLALDWFERSGAESIVLETGMGGRWDATNALTPVVSVLTAIGLDHEQWLGSTLAEIAAEKAGIIKPGIPVVSAPQEPEAEAVIRAAAAAAGAPLTFITEPCDAPLPFPGGHQRWNAALAVAAVRTAGFRLTPSAVIAGLRSTVWPARFQKLQGGRLVIDGAHNPHATAALVAAWQDEFPDEKAAIVYSAVAARDFRTTLAILAPVSAAFYFVPLSSPRGLPVTELLAASPPEIPASSWKTLTEGLDAAANSNCRVLVCGSLYLCGEVLAMESGTPFEISGQ